MEWNLLMSPKKSKRKAKKHQVIKGLKALGKLSKKPLTIKQVNKLLKGYDLNLVIAIESKNEFLEATVKDLRKNNTWLRSKLDTTYLSQNAYVKRVRADFENYETANAELKEENAFIRKKLIGQYKHFKNFDYKHRKDN